MIKGCESSPFFVRIPIRFRITLTKIKEKKMDYKDFLGSVRDYINEISDDVKVSIHTAVKNNGVTLLGLTFCKDGYNASPTIYMENYYTDYLNGEDIAGIGDRLIEMYNENCLAASLDMSFFDDFDLVKDRLYIKLINRKKNKEFLNEAPHEDFLDLAIVAYVRIFDRKIGNGIIMVKNEHLRMWQVDGARVIEEARKNTHDHDGFNLRHILDVLETLGNSVDLADEDRSQFPMYVATNRKMTCGASVLTMNDKLKEFARIIGGDYYIIPSSVHELILLRRGDNDNAHDIDMMIREVNDHELCPDEVLSDHVYVYSKDDEVLIF